MSVWIEELLQLIRRDEPAVVVTVAGVRGSAPREIGAKMIVTPRFSVATIGGGELEYQCTRIASQDLKNTESRAPELRKFTLGTNCGQCCGGAVEILFEKVNASCVDWVETLGALRAERKDALLLTDLVDGGKAVVTAEQLRSYVTSVEPSAAVVGAARDLLASGGVACCTECTETGRQYLLEPVRCATFDVGLFGAGHVGSAVVATLSQLDCDIRWIDNRRGVFPELLPGNVSTIESRNPALEASALPPGAFCLVMTHSHSLDFEICSRLLQREDMAFCGLIGSRSKRRRFERLMRQQGMSDARLQQLTCPIGVPGVGGKRPQEIAVAVAAQLLQLVSTRSGQRSTADENVIFVETRR